VLIVQVIAMLPQRRGFILKVIVSEYITSGAPIASDNIARGCDLGVSPATIRHEMARLEEEGYITRPHVSAGGVPSDKGYRYYVEYLIREAKLSNEEQHSIQQVFHQVDQEMEGWARLAAAFLSQRLKSIALVTLPRSPMYHFRHLHLVALQEFHVLFVLVFQEGKVRQRLLTLEQVVSQEELNVLANRLNELYEGLSCSQINEKEIEASPFEARVIEAILQTMQAEDENQYDQFYLDGWRHLLGQPEFMKGEKTLGLVEALEEGSLLNSLLESLGSESRVKVIIGNENRSEALQEYSVILSNYGDRAKGAIGVIGPTRLPYYQAIPTVDYLSSIMSRVLNKLFA